MDIASRIEIQNYIQTAGFLQTNEISSIERRQVEKFHKKRKTYEIQHRSKNETSIFNKCLREKK